MKIFIFAIIGAIIGFLAMVFLKVGFDTSLWTEGERYSALVLMLLGFIGGVLTATFPT